MTKSHCRYLETFDGVSVQPGDLVQVTEVSSDIYRHNEKGNLDRGEWTHPWNAPKDSQARFRLKAIMRD